jgi:hypothetical protein
MAKKLRSFQHSLILITSIAAVAVPSSTIWANVYATNLGQSANAFNTGQNVTLSYLLNESATSATVEILNASNSVVRSITGGTSLGMNQVIWDGKDNSNANLPSGNYSFRVTSGGTARPGTAWTQISTDSTLNNFELPRGVAVNKNPDSPYYGRVYVSNPRTNPTAAGRTMGDGLYMLNADLSETGIPGGSVPQTGGVDWSLDGTGGVGPFRLEVGPDSNVYITDWSDPHSGLWQAPPSLSGAWTEILDSSNGRDPSGATNVHGSISDVVVTGTGANRKLYTADEDLGSGSILYYEIGTDPVFTEDAGSTTRSGLVFDNRTANWNINFFNSLAIDKRGGFWYSQNRSAGTDKASLVHIDPATGQIDWDSLASLGSPDPLRGTQGIAYDPINDVIALATNITGNIVIFDALNRVVLTQFPFGSTTNTDIAFDNAGNLYVGNRAGERVRIWAPPTDGTFVPNQFSTNSLGPLGSIALTAAAGLPGDFNSDGKVDAGDYVTWRKNTANASLPNDGGAATQAARYTLWRSSFGNPGSGSSLNGNPTVPEPATLVLVSIIGCASLGCRRRRSV